MSQLATILLPLKIYVEGDIVQCVEDADGHPLESEVRDSDTQGQEPDSEDIQQEDGRV